MSDTGRRAAIVLFVEVHDESADTRDAGHRAEAGLKAALAGDAQLGYGHQKWHISVKGNESKHVGCDVNLTVHDMMEVGMAAGNGYLWTEFTCKAFPREDEES